MGLMMTPKRDDLRQQIRAASAQLRSPIAERRAPRKHSEATEQQNKRVLPMATSPSQDTTGQQPSRASQQLLTEAPTAFPPSRDAITQSPPRTCGHQPHSIEAEPAEPAEPGPVDLKSLRRKMERSLARLQAGEISPPVHVAAPKSCLFVQHYRQRQARMLTRVVLLNWSGMVAQEKVNTVSQHVTQLQRDLNDLEMHLAVYRDPERIQALDEMALRLVEMQEERESERAEWERERRELEKALADRQEDREVETRERLNEQEWQRKREELLCQLEHLQEELEAPNFKKQVSSARKGASTEPVGHRHEILLTSQAQVEMERCKIMQERYEGLVQQQTLTTTENKGATVKADNDVGPSNSTLSPEQSDKQWKDERSERRLRRRSARAWVDGKIRVYEKVLKLKVCSLWLRCSLQGARRRELQDVLNRAGKAWQQMKLLSILRSWRTLCACNFQALSKEIKASACAGRNVRILRPSQPENVQQSFENQKRHAANIACSREDILVQRVTPDQQVIDKENINKQLDGVYGKQATRYAGKELGWQGREVGNSGEALDDSQSHEVHHRLRAAEDALLLLLSPSSGRFVGNKCLSSSIPKS